MSISATNRQGYTKTDQPSQWKIQPTQPMFGDRQSFTSSDTTFFQYDLITPWGMGQSVANADQTSRVMVGWGLKILCGILATTNHQLIILVNSGINTTFTEIDISPISITGGTKWQFFTVGPMAAAHVRGQIRAVGSNSSIEFHVRLLEQ